MESQGEGFMMFVAEHSDIDPNDLEKLYYNGFDNPESLSMLNIDQLQELGVSDPAIILAKIEATLEVFNEIIENGGKFGSHSAEAIQEQPRDMEQSVLTSPPTEEPELILPKDAKEISRDLMLGLLPNSIKRAGMSKKEILDTMTHLHLSEKKIYTLNVTAGKSAFTKEDQDKPIFLAFTPHLQVIYLQQNYLTHMGDCFMGLKKLTQINLFGNYISKMDCFSDCIKLRKLYLENNRINRLEGLQNC